MSNDLVEIDDDILPVKTSQGTDVLKDIDYSRNKLLELIETGMNGATELAEVAASAQDSLSYERLGNYLEKIAILQEKLVAISIKKEELAGPKPSSGPQNVTQNLFVGSPAELAEILKNNGTISGSN